MNSSAPPEMAIHVSNAHSNGELQNPPETSPEESSGPTPADQVNGVAAATQEMAACAETGLAATPVPNPETTADPAGASADLPVHEEFVPLADTPILSSEEPHATAPTVEVESQESVVAAEISACQDVEQISVDAKVPEGEASAVAEEIPCDPKTSAPEEVIANGEDVKAADAPVSRNLLLDAAKALPCEVNVTVATQNEDLDKEAVTLLSKAIQSKESSKREGPPHSTCRLSGWFVLISKHSPPYFLTQSYECTFRHIFAPLVK